MSQLMRLWYLSHRRSAKAQASLRVRAVSPEPSLFAHMKYGSRRRIWQKIRHLALLDGCACTFEELSYGGQKVPKSHELVHITIYNSKTTDTGQVSCHPPRDRTKTAWFCFTGALRVLKEEFEGNQRWICIYISAFLCCYNWCQRVYRLPH